MNVCFQPTLASNTKHAWLVTGNPWVQIFVQKSGRVEGFSIVPSVPVVLTTIAPETMSWPFPTTILPNSLFSNHISFTTKHIHLVTAKFAHSDLFM